jgi:hypothetical protein
MQSIANSNNPSIEQFKNQFGQGNVLLVLRRFNSVFGLEIPGQTAAESTGRYLTLHIHLMG